MFILLLDRFLLIKYNLILFIWNRGFKNFMTIQAS